MSEDFVHQSAAVYVGFIVDVHILYGSGHAPMKVESNYFYMMESDI